MKITTKSQIEKILPELKPNKVTNAHRYYFRPTIGNTHVSCSFYSFLEFSNISNKYEFLSSLSLLLFTPSADANL